MTPLVALTAFVALAAHAGAAAAPSAPMPATRQALPLPTRSDMVQRIRSGIRTAAPDADDQWFEQALEIVGSLPREAFVPKAAKPFAYLGTPLFIGHGQTISAPDIVALMTAALKLTPNANVLDIGTGSGYQAAVLSPLARRVSSIEIVAPLAREADHRLRSMGYRNIDVRAGDGFAGWPEHAPFDGIIVAAGAADVPAPLLKQLKPGGRLVMPIGPSTFQEQLLVLTKAPDGTITKCSLGFTAFVPFTGVGERTVGLRRLADRSIPLCYSAPVT